MRDGCYRYANRKGEVALVQFSGGVPVEYLQFSGLLKVPPKRVTRRRIADSVTDAIAQARRAEEERRMLAWVRFTGGEL